MKRWIAIAIGLLAIPIALYAGSNTVMIIGGDVSPTIQVTLTDAARTLDNVVVTAGGVVKKNGVYPVGAYITASAQIARFAMGGTTPTVDNVGHTIAIGESVRILGGSAVGSLKFVNGSAEDESILHITLEY